MCPIKIKKDLKKLNKNDHDWFQLKSTIKVSIQYFCSLIFILKYNFCMLWSVCVINWMFRKKIEFWMLGVGLDFTICGDVTKKSIL